MAQATTKIAIDRNKVVIDHADAIRHWTKHFGVTAEELHRAIEKVGNAASAVRKELRNRKAELIARSADSRERDPHPH